MEHHFHKAVAKEIENKLSGHGKLIKDSACGGNQRISLYAKEKKGLDTRMCDVDLIIEIKRKVKVIIEIEESGFIPTKICGKFLQSAIAKYYIYGPRPETKVPYDDHVSFIQVLDGSKCLPKGTKKKEQARIIEQEIRELLPLNGSNINCYHLNFVESENYREDLKNVCAIVLENLK